MVNFVVLLVQNSSEISTICKMLCYLMFNIVWLEASQYVVDHMYYRTVGVLLVMCVLFSECRHLLVADPVIAGGCGIGAHSAS